MISGDVYEEVYEVLMCMNDAAVNKIPKDIFNNIKEKRNIHFYTKINKKDIFNKNNISKEAMDFLCYLDYNYWMNDENKKKVRDINSQRKLAEEEEKLKKYNPDNIFKNRNDVVKNEESNTSIIELKKEGFFKKIINKIKKWIRY